MRLSLVDLGTNIKKAVTGHRVENLSINKDNDCHELKDMTYILFSLSFCKYSQKKKKKDNNINLIWRVLLSTRGILT